MTSSNEGGGCVLVLFFVIVFLGLNATGIAGMFAKSIAIANHQVSICDRYATTDLSYTSNAQAIAVKFNQCMEEF